MKERPILFSAPMVLAILDGRKTQTRRVFKSKFKPDSRLNFVKNLSAPNERKLVVWKPNGEWTGQKCPFGSIGDRLWVRETFAIAFESDYDAIVYRADKKAVFRDNIKYELDTYAWDMEGLKWKPSIFMPRAASRISLEITDIRCERLQQITPNDAIMEGIDSFRPVPGDGHSETLYRRYSDVGGRPGNWISIPELSFRSLWEKINGPESWANNPYVWVISFIQV